MDCREFQERWVAAIESRDEPRLESLRSHLAACNAAECVRLYDDYQLLARALRDWKGPAAPSGIARRALAELESGRPSPSHRRPSTFDGLPRRRSPAHIVAASGVAALVLCLIWLAGRTNRENGSSGTMARSVSGRPEIVAPATTVTPIPRDQDAAALREVGESYVALAQKTTGFATDLAFLVVPGGDEGGPEDSDDGAWVDRIEERIEPLRSGVSGKLGEWFGSPAT